MAMPIALGAVLILAVVAVAVTTLAQSGESSARRHSADQKAFALAESGLERAVATLHAAADPSAAAAVPPGSEAQGDGAVSWAAALAGNTWTLSGTGTIPGEAGAGAASRTVSVRYLVSVAGSPWEYVFAGSPGGCTTLAAGTTVQSALWVDGDLCIGDGATFAGPKLHVEGVVNTGATGQVGTAVAPIGSANLVAGCAGGSPDPHPCSTSDRVWASSLTQAAGELSKPALDLDRWYAEARPGPSHTCTTGGVPGGFDNDGSRNGSRPPFDLTGGTGYSCVVTEGGTPRGSLEWLPGTPGVLTVTGVVYFDGDVTSSGDAVYTGRGTIYASGGVTIASGARLCGAPGCGAGWNPGADLVALVAGGDVTLGGGATFQGAAYAQNAYTLGAGAQNWGPVVADRVAITDDAGPLAALPALPPGVPGIDTTLHRVGGSWNG